MKIIVSAFWDKFERSPIEIFEVRWNNREIGEKEMDSMKNSIV
jgi:hypothetical protein